MTALWTAEAVVAATGGETAGGGWVASGVSIDTRTIAPGDLFVALVGPNRDAHDFVATALGKGAAAALVSRVPEGADPARLVLVPDTQIALEGLGHAGRARSAARIAGVTGSVGKTGTKEALRHVLSRQAPTHASAASHNNHWGVPLSLARLPEGASYGVLELGMNHPGELRALTRMVRPHVAIITTVAPAHLAFFPSVEAIADAKSEILEGLEPGGVAVLNRDSEHYPRMRRHAERSPAGRIVTFGRHEAADWRLEDVALGPGHSEVTVSIRRKRRLAYRLGPPGRHWVLNSLGVLAVAEALGADVARAASALADLRPPAGRGERRQVTLPGGGEALLLDESYNANPASMRAAIELLGQMPGRRIAALGDMLELGEHSAALHAALVEPILAAGIDLVLTCGPQMAHLHAALPAERRGAHESDSTSLAAAVKEALRPGDTLLVKGSLGSRMARIIDALQAEEKPTVSRAAL